GEATRRLPRPLSAAIRKQARRLGVSPASVMHLAWGMVLARTTGRSDVVFGTVLFGRMQAGTETGRMLGLLLNTLPLRVSVGDGSAVEAAKRTHALLVELLRHEHAPLALAMRASGVAAPAPLFTSLLNYRYNVEGKPADAGGDEKAVAILSGHERTNYPVTLSVDDMGLDFALDAMVSERIGAERVCAYMQTALEQLVHAFEHAPAQAIRSLDVMPAAEREQVVTAWNQVREAHGDGSAACVHQRFEAQAQRTPEAIALVHWAAKISYGELNARANRLAHHLRTLGVGPDQRVAICLPRGIDLITAILAVLKAGGAYVPLDPTYASSRLGMTLGDSRPAVLILDAEGRAALGEHAAGVAHVIDLDRDSARWADAPAGDLEGVGVARHHLAYIIYTSGSTGRPKGVMVEHAQVVRLFDTTAEWFGFGAG
ncbi:MAG: AMP-binding protein, partial [Solirubrobacteraceae bacterium]